MRRFFRFSIRDLLWLTLVVALGWRGSCGSGGLRAQAAQAKADYDATRDAQADWRTDLLQK